MNELDAETFKALKTQIEVRKREAIARAEAEAAHAVDALTVLEKLFTDGALGLPEGEHKVTVTGGVNLSQGRAAWVSKEKHKPFPTSQAIRNIIEKKSPDHIFSQPIIYDELFMLHEEIRRRPHKSVRGQIAATLKALVKEGLIQLVKEADGQEPAEYKIAEKKPEDKKVSTVVGLYQ